jgi:hypothetical protein
MACGDAAMIEPKLVTPGGGFNFVWFSPGGTAVRPPGRCPTHRDSWTEPLPQPTEVSLGAASPMFNIGWSIASLSVPPPSVGRELAGGDSIGTEAVSEERSCGAWSSEAGDGAEWGAVDRRRRSRM